MGAPATPSKSSSLSASLSGSRPSSAEHPKPGQSPTANRLLDEAAAVFQPSDSVRSAEGPVEGDKVTVTELNGSGARSSQVPRRDLTRISRGSVDNLNLNALLRSSSHAEAPLRNASSMHTLDRYQSSPSQTQSIPSSPDQSPSLRTSSLGQSSPRSRVSKFFGQETVI